MPDDVFRWVIAGAVILACLAFLVQAVVVMLLYRVARNTQSKIMPLVDRADPILVTTRQILEENKPRIAEVSVEAVEIAKTARRQADRIGDLLEESSERAKARLAQIDRTVDETVEQVEQVGDAVKTAVLKPVKEVNGLMAGMKAAISTYAAGASRRPSVDHATQDEEMFI
jgi:F0F1-type ATP synthase membrane subunit b/b'